MGTFVWRVLRMRFAQAQGGYRCVSPRRRDRPDRDRVHRTRTSLLPFRGCDRIPPIQPRAKETAEVEAQIMNNMRAMQRWPVPSLRRTGVLV